MTDKLMFADNASAMLRRVRICRYCRSTVVSRVVFSIASGSEWRTDGQKRFWSQLKNSKPVRDRPYVSMGASSYPYVGYQMGPSPTPMSALTPKPGVKKSPFQISANQIDVVETVVQTHFRIHWLVVK